MKRPHLGDEHYQLLSYITTYRRSRYGKAKRREILEQLISAYAKQLVSGITDNTVRANMLALINQADTKTAEDRDRQIQKQKALLEAAKNAGYVVD